MGLLPEKAYFYALEMEPPFQRGREGHDLVKLSESWPESVRSARPDLAEAQTRLNLFAENTRYPHLRVSSPPNDYVSPHEDYGDPQSDLAIKHAEAIMEVCEKLVTAAANFALTLGKAV